MTVPTAPRAQPPLARQLTLASIAVLVLGVLGAALAWFSADPNPRAGQSYQIIGGEVYAVAGDDDKRRTYEIERMSGKSGVLLDQFQTWFAGLWQGRNLALSLLVVALLIAAALRWCAGEVAADAAYRAQHPNA